MPAAERRRIFIEVSGPDVDALFAETWWQLRQVARARLRGERSDHTLSPTALVNEAYLRLKGTENLAFDDPEQFLGLAGWVMRNVLLDHARRRAADKRQSPTPAGPPAPFTPAPTLATDLERALGTLREVSARQAQILELRTLADLSFEEIAQQLGVSESTVYREWRLARAFLVTFLEVEV